MILMYCNLEIRLETEKYFPFIFDGYDGCNKQTRAR